MLQGWNTQVETWSSAQMNKYLKWSSTTVPPTTSDYSGLTDYASLNPTVPSAVEMTTFVPGENSVITTNDAGLGLFEGLYTPPTLESVLGGIFQDPGSAMARYTCG